MGNNKLLAQKVNLNALQINKTSMQTIATGDGQSGATRETLSRERGYNDRPGTIVAACAFRVINLRWTKRYASSALISDFFRFFLGRGACSFGLRYTCLICNLYCARHLFSHSFFPWCDLPAGNLWNNVFSSHISFRLLSQMRELKRAKTDMPLNAKRALRLCTYWCWSFFSTVLGLAVGFFMDEKGGKAGEGEGFGRGRKSGSNTVTSYHTACGGDA